LRRLEKVTWRLVGFSIRFICVFPRTISDGRRTDESRGSSPARPGDALLSELGGGVKSKSRNARWVSAEGKGRLTKNGKGGGGGERGGKREKETGRGRSA
jgi:hypothetical protein